MVGYQPSGRFIRLQPLAINCFITLISLHFVLHSVSYRLQAVASHCANSVATALPPFLFLRNEAPMKKRLTPSAVKALDPTDKPYDVHDAGCPGLAVRVLGQKNAPLKSFIVVARFPGSSNPTRVKIGSFLDSWTVQRGWEGLNDARRKARAWLDQIERGVDPRVDIERKRRAEQQKRANTFGLVAEAFIEDKLPGERRGA